jgi:hypothetical protein
MTAFLTFGFVRAHATPTRLREASRRGEASRPASWLITPIRHWRSGSKAPELPPG